MDGIKTLLVIARVILTTIHPSPATLCAGHYRRLHQPMYRCNICQAVSSPGKPRLTHCIHRPDGNIAQELPVCSSCQFRLASGTSLADLRLAVKRGQARQLALNAKTLTWSSDQPNPQSIAKPVPAVKTTKPARLLGQEL